MGGQGFWVEAEAEGDVPSPGVHGGTGLWAEVSAGRERLVLGLRSLSLGGGYPQAGQGHLGQVWGLARAAEPRQPPRSHPPTHSLFH